MTLQPDDTVGAYRIVGQIGVGGMGEVYRASDARLGRDVAIKVLPAEWVADQDRMARFHREAQVLASLNHPHIAAIYGFEESTAAHALVMELVEGATLADRIQASPTGLPIEDVLSIARQIAEALEYAHERGIVHRDLKPANIKITPDGQVKVLDFGLAKALSKESSNDGAANSPTLSLAATAAGMILGTAAYMAPEQAKGKAVDRRADIWAFGVIVYEMLTGRMAFAGETASETMAFVMTREPEWSALPAETPPRLRDLLRRSFVKDPRSRARDIGDLRIAIEEIASGDSPLVAGLTPGPTPAITGTRLGRVLPWAIAVASLTAAGMALWAPWSSAPPPSSTVRLNVNLGDDAVFLSNINSPANLAMSPDGAILALVAGKNVDSARLYVRRLDELQATPLAGTEGARNPFFSPDGQWIGFFDAAKLKKIAVTGGAVVTIADVTNNRGGTWTEDGSIIFSGAQSALMRVAEGGGTPRPLTKLADGEFAHRWPQVLPGGRAVIFTAAAGGSGSGIGRVVAQRLPDGETKVLQPNGFFARYLPTGLGSPTRGDRGGGHLVYMSGSTMFAAPFDSEKLEWLGVKVPVLDGVLSSPGPMGAGVSVSNTGALVYVPGGAQRQLRQMAWLDRDGRQSPLSAAAAIFNDPRVSPDGRRIAVSISAGATGSDIWIYEWARDAMSRLTFDPQNDQDPLWLDASHLVYHRQTPGVQGREMFWQPADGTGEAKRLVEGQSAPIAISWHPGGKLIAAHDSGRPTSPDLFTLPMTGDARSGWQAGTPVTFLATPFNESEPAFSPDGRWLAYQSNETGRFEVYVRSFPGPGGRWQVSVAGGEMPTWSPKGKELLFRVDQQVMVVEYAAAKEGSFSVSAPRRWSETRLADLGSAVRNFDVHPDGQRVLAVISPQGDAARTEVVYVSNFFDELRRLAPVRK